MTHSRYMKFDEEIVLVEAFSRAGRGKAGRRAAIRALPSRSQVGISTALVRLGLYAPGRHDMWKMNDERVLVPMWKAGKKCKEIAAALGKSESNVYCYVQRHHKRLGIKQRLLPPSWNPNEKSLLRRELEAVIERVRNLTGRERGAIAGKLVGEMMAYRKARKFADVDLGGMSNNSITQAGVRKHLPRRKDAA